MCVFCKRYSRYRDMDKITNFPFPQVYKVALMAYSKVGKEYVRSTECYNTRGIGFKLNFCPECGEDLRARKSEK